MRSVSTMWIFAALSLVANVAHAEDVARDEAGPVLMHRHRLSIAPETVYFVSNGAHESFAGMGLGVSYFFGDRWGLSLSGDWLSTTGSPPSAIDPAATSELPSALATALATAKLEVEIARARGSLVQKNGGPVDVLVSMGPGAIWTRPASQIDPSHRTFTYTARPALEVDLGARVFVSPSFALSLQAGSFTYNEPEEETAVASTPDGRRDPTTWFGDAKLRTGAMLRFSVAFLAPPPERAR